MPELAPVELLDEPPLAAVRVSAELPVVVDVDPPPVPELLCVELPDEPAEEGFEIIVVGVLLAVALVEFVDDVSLLVLPWFDAALSVEEADLDALASSEALADFE